MAGVVAAAVAARSWLLWSTPLVPGRNGGYYLIQARALLEHGKLGIPDLPLNFIVQAFFAKLLQLVTGRSLEASVLSSVKLCDAVLPALAAVPVFLLARRWCAQAGRGSWPAAAAAVVAALGAPALSMVGDFEKNSLGLLWLAALIVALHLWMTQRTRARAAAVLACLGLCGLTHIGVFGAALALTALTWTADLALLRGREGLKTLYHVGAVALCGALVVGTAAGIVLWKFDPARIRRLAGALSNPVVFFQNGGHTDNRGPGFQPPTPGAGMPDRFGPPPGDGQPPFARNGRPDFAAVGHRPPMGPGMMGPYQGFAKGLFALVVAGALGLSWYRRRELSAADRASVVGCSVGLLLLTGPWVSGDIAGRFQLIAMIPAAVSVAFIMAYLPGKWSAPVCATAVLALVAATSTPLLRRGGQPVISVAAFEELGALKTSIAHPERTLVVAPHGLEWWVAWTLHTHVAQPRAVSASDWSTYDTVLFIKEKRHDHGALGGMAGPPGFGGPGGSLGGPPGGPPMMGERIPEGAETVHDGTYFKLARVTQPTDTIRESGGSPPPGTEPTRN